MFDLRALVCFSLLSGLWLVSASAMPGLRSPVALARRQVRDDWYRTAHSSAGKKFVEVNAAIAQDVRRIVKAKDRHVQLDASNGFCSHFGRNAALAAFKTGHLDPKILKSDLDLLSVGNAAKHDNSHALRVQLARQVAFPPLGGSGAGLSTSGGVALDVAPRRSGGVGARSPWADDDDDEPPAEWSDSLDVACQTVGTVRDVCDASSQCDLGIACCFPSFGSDAAKPPPPPPLEVSLLDALLENLAEVNLCFETRFDKIENSVASLASSAMPCSVDSAVKNDKIEDLVLTLETMKTEVAMMQVLLQRACEDKKGLLKQVFDLTRSLVLESTNSIFTKVTELHATSHAQVLATLCARDADFVDSLGTLPPPAPVDLVNEETEAHVDLRSTALHGVSRDVAALPLGAAEASADAVTFHPGQFVRLYGLSSVHLNGTIGCIVGYDDLSCRYQVQYNGKPPVKIKSSNIEVASCLSCLALLTSDVCFICGEGACSDASSASDVAETEDDDYHDAPPSSGSYQSRPLGRPPTSSVRQSSRCVAARSLLASPTTNCDDDVSQDQGVPVRRGG